MRVSNLSSEWTQLMDQGHDWNIGHSPINDRTNESKTWPFQFANHSQSMRTAWDDTSLFYKNIHILVGIHQNPYFEPCQGLLTIWTKLFHYHKVNHDNSARSFLMTCHKNQYVINAKKHSKRNLYCSNINELTWKENKSFK